MKIHITEFISRRISILLSIVALIASVVVVGIVVYEFGVPMNIFMKAKFASYREVLLTTLWAITTFRFILSGTIGKSTQSPLLRGMGYGLFTLVSLTSLSLSYGVIQADSFISMATSNLVVTIILLMVSISEISAAITKILSAHANPSSILSGSFAIIILIGSLLLQLPNCSTVPIDYIDSLFIATSAVCVTGLTPIDISQILTTDGQVVLLLLIQIGGLGIMTITSFFGLFFAGGGSLSNQLMIKELLSGDSLNGLLKTLFKIIGVTLCVEAAGAITIFGVIEGVKGIDNHLFFAIFHAISAFCNAGFSTLSGNLYDPIVRNLGGVMWTVSFLIIFGGIGFPIFFNFLSVIWHYIRNLGKRVMGKRWVREPHLWNLNSYIVLRFTTIIILVSWGLLLLLEWNNSLAEFSFWDKLAQGFLAAITPRTAGFSGVDLTKMLPASIIVTMILMWIGGAPQSTAGGVKVTTVYVAFKNIFSTTAAEKNIEVHHRSIPNFSVRRAFAIITLSFTIIGISVMILSILEPDTELSKLMFEVISAIGTVGLSLNVTPTLCTESKVLLILLMFIGRIGVITLFTIFVRRNINKPYAFPEENILIN